MARLPPRRHPHYTGWTDVEAYCWPFSHEPGDPVAVHCSSRAESFAVEVARVGARRDVVWRSSDIRADDQRSEDLADDDRAWAEGCDWPVGFVVPTERSWPSGFYHIRLLADGGSAYASARASASAGNDRSGGDAFFVLRPPAGRRGNPLLVLATNTWNAYNQWGGRCLYSGAESVSFARPLERGYLHRPGSDDPSLPDGFDGRVANIDGDPEHAALQRYQADGHWPLWTGSAGWHNWERRFVAWAETNGWSIDVAVNADLEFHPEVLDGANGLLSVGHDEYWSWAMRDTVDAWVDDGGRWGVFSGNTCFWQVRFTDDGRSMVCHRGAARGTDAVADRSRMTGSWSDPLVRRPENTTTGLSFTRGGYYRMGLAVADGDGTYTIHRPDHWALSGTGLAAGDRLGEGRFIVAYEVDGCDLTTIDGRPQPTGLDGTPGDLTVIATAPARLISITDERCEAPAALWASVDPPGDLESTAAMLFGDDRPEHVERIAAGHAVIGAFERGAGSVFNAGTTDWAYGLDPPEQPDPAVATVTTNVLRHVTGHDTRFQGHRPG
ncbi:MAG: hypothetical protein OEW83_08270 [Acidimicrobiia bacterium]|nr:hypothetical protein [Acidimicrobiia bacterium]